MNPEPWHLSHWPTAGEASRRLRLATLEQAIAGAELEGRAALLAALPDARRRASLMANFLPIKAPGGTVEYTAQFDIVLGFTPRQA